MVVFAIDGLMKPLAVPVFLLVCVKRIITTRIIMVEKISENKY
jgi:hypothetical protein